LSIAPSMAITSAAARISKAIIVVALPPGLARNRAIARSMRTGNGAVLRPVLARRAGAWLQRMRVSLLSGETTATGFVGRNFTKRKQQRHRDDNRKHHDHVNPLPRNGARSMPAALFFQLSPSALARISGSSAAIPNKARFGGCVLELWLRGGCRLVDLCVPRQGPGNHMGWLALPRCRR
jgi:hypothetical protein